MNIKESAQKLWDAEQGSYAIGMLTEENSDMTIVDAYNIQLENVKRRLSLGQKLIGMKIGLTSTAMQNLLNVGEPDYGHLFDSMLLLEGEPCKMSELVAPKVEGELSFCIDKTLKGPGVTIADVYEATAWVTPSIEIVDSRIKDWKIKLADTVADNGSAAKFVVGGRMKLIGDIDMQMTGMAMEKNGELIGSGVTAEVWGNPAASVAWLANKLSEFDIELKAGSIVMAGAVTAAVPAQAGDIFTVSFQDMGKVTVKFVD